MLCWELEVSVPSPVKEGDQLRWNFSLSQLAPLSGLTAEFALTDYTDPLLGDITYNVAGSSNIIDFELLLDSAGVITGARVGIAEGSTSATLLNNVITDGVLKGLERVVYSLADAAGYAVDTNTNAAAFTIADVPVLSGSTSSYRLNGGFGELSDPLYRSSDSPLAADSNTLSLFG